MNPLAPIACTLDRLASGDLVSSSLVEACLAAIRDPTGEGSRTFTRVSAEQLTTNAATYNRQRQPGPLAGLPISIKALFDIEGETTSAGSTVLSDMPLATRDATVVRRLRAAGAVLMGHTNMTEFAFSGLGLNPHFGTPRNPYDRTTQRIPGGSSSGAAVSVADGMALAAIGSDTGGSIRIPAALCGLTGFKPTAHRVPLDGALPLSTTLDSAGPIAPTVACCARIDAVLAGETPHALIPPALSTLRFGILQGYVLDSLEPTVAHAFGSALSLLSSRGATLIDVSFSMLDQIHLCNRNGGFSAAEAYAWHRPLLERASAHYDPRVLSRILRGGEMSASEYIDLLHARRRIIKAATSAFQPFDAILLPTVPRIAPPVAELEASDSAYFDANAAMLRNPSVFNFLDGCALSVPCHLPGEAPVGFMIAGPAMRDRAILNIGAAIESEFRTAGRAVHGLVPLLARAAK